MALKDLLAYVDDKLQSVFETRAYDPAKDREKLAKRIAATKDKFLQTEPPRGRKDFNVANNVVAYTPPVKIDARHTLHIPAERFAEFLDRLKAEVEAGELDKELEAAAKGDDADGAATVAKAPRKPRASGGERTGWSEERRAKFAETVAKRKAAKGG